MYKQIKCLWEAIYNLKRKVKVLENGAGTNVLFGEGSPSIVPENSNSVYFDTKTYDLYKWNTEDEIWKLQINGAESFGTTQTDPVNINTPPAEGEPSVYLNTINGTIWYWNGTIWKSFASVEGIDDLPTLTQGNFLVGGVSGNEQRTISPNDVGGLTAVTGSRVPAFDGPTKTWNPSVLISTTEDVNAIALRTSEGKLAIVGGTNNNHAVTLQQLNNATSGIDLVNASGYNGTKDQDLQHQSGVFAWKDSQDVRYLNVTLNGTGNNPVVYTHGLSNTPSFFLVQALNAASKGIDFVIANSTEIQIHYTTPPVIGTDNLEYNIMLKV